MKKLITGVAVVLFALFFFQRGVKPEIESWDEFQIIGFSHLPVKYEGRKKPMDTLARNVLTVLSGKQTVRVEGEKVSAMQWFLDNISQRPDALDYEVFRIENRDLLSSLKLPERKRFRYSYRELMPRLFVLPLTTTSKMREMPMKLRSR